MQQVINGRLYDTDDATYIATHNPVSDREDFNFLYERLFRTDSGEYFLAGEGGPKTSYRKRVGTGEYTGSSDVRTLSEEEAFQWCQQKGIDAETIMDEFGHLVERA